MSLSLFEIIGPVMVGPSSSHTAGMARIGIMVRNIAGSEPKEIRILFSPRMKTTYQGHQSHAALVGGLLGLSEDSLELRNSLSLAQQRQIPVAVDFLPEGCYPQNTAKVCLKLQNSSTITVTGTSTGGGKIRNLANDDITMTMKQDEWIVLIKSNHPLTIHTDESVQSGVCHDGKYLSAFCFSEKPDITQVQKTHTQSEITDLQLLSPLVSFGASKPGFPGITSCEEACRKAAEDGISLSELAIRYETARSGRRREEIIHQMQQNLEKMKQSAEHGLTENRLLIGLASGHDGKLLQESCRSNKTVSGGLIPKASAIALGILEHNGSMGCVVAAPTAGSAGILPGCILSIQEERKISDETLLHALFTAALFGVIMDAKGVSFSGSIGGCQGEVGVSSALSAAAIASIVSNEPQTVSHAMALALKNLLGLVCDPVGGSIEVPCIKRNAVGVSKAFIAADMALAGIQSVIPPDEVIDALIDVQKRMPSALKCASVGGLAGTETAKTFLAGR
ncbi:MAG: L-serine ammonia-lyase, iron-sulfur-dependent, subunit alpha [Clostridia bacterium]|nr:L-serine ammonia-lyase, iron-sulfur-dependent, subunit alpha [Clostridia bacterium]